MAVNRRNGTTVPPAVPVAGLGDIDGGQEPAKQSQSLDLQAAADAAASADDTDDEVHDLDAQIERLQQIRAQKTGIDRPALRQPLRESMRSELSDAEILRMYEAEDSDQFYIDLTVVPEDEVYEWKRLEVYGKEDKAYEAELARRGWTPVQADKHPGYFMPRGYHGHIVRGGQGLYSMPAIEYQRRARYQQLKAMQQVQDQERVLGIAPPGTGPRDHARVRPNVKKDYESVPGMNAIE